jgi:hypothetical protein
MAPRRCIVAPGLLAVFAVVTASGCINLGLGTRHYQDNPQTESRLRSLENRVAAMEGMLAPGTSISAAAATAQ